MLWLLLLFLPFKPRYHCYLITRTTEIVTNKRHRAGQRMQLAMTTTTSGQSEQTELWTPMSRRVRRHSCCHIRKTVHMIPSLRVSAVIATRCCQDKALLGSGPTQTVVPYRSKMTVSQNLPFAQAGRFGVFFFHLLYFLPMRLVEQVLLLVHLSTCFLL